MTRNEALIVAKINRTAHEEELGNYLFNAGAPFNAFENYGFLNGQYHVGEFTFSIAEVTAREI